MKRKSRKLITAIENILLIALISLITWEIISWADVVIHNTNPEYIYSKFNFFIWLASLT